MIINSIQQGNSFKSNVFLKHSKAKQKAIENLRKGSPLDFIKQELSSDAGKAIMKQIYELLGNKNPLFVFPHKVGTLFVDSNTKSGQHLKAQLLKMKRHSDPDIQQTYKGMLNEIGLSILKTRDNLKVISFSE